MRHLLLGLGLLVAGGCMSDYSARDRVTIAAREYNDGVRWFNLEKAAKHLRKEERDRFYERHQLVEDELEIADYEVVSIEVDKSDKKKNRATARVDFTWTLKRVGIVEKTSVVEKWEEDGNTWVLARIERVRGKPLSIFSEPERARTDEAPELEKAE
jgi:hypothetical protein